MSRFAKVLIMLTIVLMILLGLSIGIFRQKLKVAKTRAQLRTYQAAIQLFKQEYGRSPTSLVELVKNPKGFTFVAHIGPAFMDEWGRPIMFAVPPDTNSFGTLRSFGRDGVPGGNSFDADIEIRFP